MKHYLLAIIVILFASSCSKEQQLIRREDRLIGAWRFEKVTYKRDGAIFRDNITRDFEGDIVEFFPNYQALYDDYSNGIVYDGSWAIFLDRGDFEYEDACEFFVDMYFFDPYGAEEFGYYAGINLLTRNKLNIEAFGRRGSYRMKLRRL